MFSGWEQRLGQVGTCSRRWTSAEGKGNDRELIATSLALNLDLALVFHALALALDLVLVMLLMLVLVFMVMPFNGLRVRRWQWWASL